MDKTYTPKNFENKIYEMWERGNYFAPDKKTSVAELKKAKIKPYTIMMPPPNITGNLHIGHAYNITLQDVLIRFKRMSGYAALLLPGTDHASIATEVKLVGELAKEGLTKEGVGREAFLKRAYEWSDNTQGVILNQIKKIGASADFSRYKFTMDSDLNEAVKRAFVSYFDKGWIYKAERLVNWCVTCNTAISDAEVDHIERDGQMWYIKYQVVSESGVGAIGKVGEIGKVAGVVSESEKQYITIATTRPETMLGDVAVAVSPSDKRYKKLIGKSVVLPLVNRVIPVVGDSYVSADFGTGAVKVTPNHDFNDFEIAVRHSLKGITVISKCGSITDSGGVYSGLDKAVARKKVVADLEKLGLLEQVKAHKNSVGVCSRCGDVIEPLPSLQWYLKMGELARMALGALSGGSKVSKGSKSKAGETASSGSKVSKAGGAGGLNLYPKRFVKQYEHWLSDIKDWCISRQLWWGQQIPVYYCECGKTFASVSEPFSCVACGGTKLKQETDVLDTWFSSALWPFSTLGWGGEQITNYKLQITNCKSQSTSADKANNNKADKGKDAGVSDLDYFYPGDVLVTGYDILFFWVIRMVFSGLEFLGELPFKDVLFNGIVRDGQGRKMSKSLGNGIDPLDIIDEYGADAMRWALINGSTIESDIRFSKEKTESAKGFINKIWQAARFVEMNSSGADNTKAAGKAVKGNDLATDNSDELDFKKISLSTIDKWLLTKLNSCVAGVTKHLESYEFGLAAEKLYNFTWSVFCDWYIEFVKGELAEFTKPDNAGKLSASKVSETGGGIAVLDYTLKAILKLLHPVIPFVTEHIYHNLTGRKIIVSEYPRASAIPKFVKDEKEIDSLLDVIRKIRNVKVEFTGSAFKQTKLYYVASATMQKKLKDNVRALKKQAYISDVIFVSKESDITERCTKIVTDLGLFLLPMGELIDTEKEKARLGAEIAKAKAEIERAKGKLENVEFTKKAPPNLVAQERDKLKKYQDLLSKLEKEFKDNYK
ncbi:MAG: valine--tRNA ligase [Firmicutes bacterium]|nr:valine--tRNA ligase [Bacillota bacterium]